MRRPICVMRANACSHGAFFQRGIPIIMQHAASRGAVGPRRHHVVFLQRSGQRRGGSRPCTLVKRGRSLAGSVPDQRDAPIFCRGNLANAVQIRGHQIDVRSHISMRFQDGSDVRLVDRSGPGGHRVLRVVGDFGSVGQRQAQHVLVGGAPGAYSILRPESAYVALISSPPIFGCSMSFSDPLR